MSWFAFVRERTVLLKPAQDGMIKECDNSKPAFGWLVPLNLTVSTTTPLRAVEGFDMCHYLFHVLSLGDVVHLVVGMPHALESLDVGPGPGDPVHFVHLQQIIKFNLQVLAEYKNK